MQLTATNAEARAIIGAMAAIAASGGEQRISAADRTSLLAAYHYVLRQSGTWSPWRCRGPTPKRSPPRCAIRRWQARRHIC
jgi:hypothetical protein